MRLKRTVWQYEVRRSRVMLASDVQPLYADAITNPFTVAAVFRGIVGEQPREHFLAFYLDAGSRIMGFETIAIGGSCSVEVEPAQVFRGALLAGAHHMIVAHNHPSGRSEPSQADADLTRRLLDAGKLIGIPLVDHVVVTTTDHHSFANAGAL